MGTRPVVMRLSAQSVRRPLRHLVAYGSTNKYRPERKSKASGATARRPTQVAYLPLTTATMLMMTARVKAMDSQRWVCRTHLFQFNGPSSFTLLSCLRRPVGQFNAELLGVLRGQPLPAIELHGLGAEDGSNRLAREEPLQDVEADVPARGAPRDEAAI